MGRHFAKTVDSPESRKQFPIQSWKDDIGKAIQANRVVLIQGVSGCGKTTHVPQYLLNHEDKCSVVIAQPTSIGAHVAAQYVCEERGCRLETNEDGYKIEADDNSSTLYVTKEKMLEMISDDFSAKCTHLVIDDVQCMDATMMLLLLCVKRFLNAHSSIKLILMAPAMEVDRLMVYFGLEAAIIDHPPDKQPEVYLEEILNNGNEPAWILADIEERQSQSAQVQENVYNIAVNLLNSLKHKQIHTRGHILVFLPGLDEINRLESMLKPDFGMSRLEYDEEEPSNVERVILTTRDAEESITITGVDCVIDFCLTKSTCVDPQTFLRTVKTNWISKGQGQQVMGRTDGIVYRLVTQKFYKTLPAWDPTELDESGLETIVLLVKKHKLGNPHDVCMSLLYPPTKPLILERTIQGMKEVGMLRDGKTHNELDGTITVIGEIMADMSISLACTRLIVLGDCFGIIEHAIIIAAATDFGNPFKDVSSNIDSFLSHRDYSRGSSSDLIATYNAYMYWKNKVRPQEYSVWASGACIQLNVLRSIDKKVIQLKEGLKRWFSSLSSEFSVSKIALTEKEELLVKIIICGAYYPNYFTTPLLEDNLQDCSANSIYFKTSDIQHENSVAVDYLEQLSDGSNFPLVRNYDEDIIATFSNDAISLGMHRALKLRQMGKRLLLPPTEDFKSQGLHLSTQILPCITEELWDVEIQHNEGPDRFWVVKDLTQLRKTENAINKCREKLTPMNSVSPELHVLAKRDDKYRRGRVLITELNDLSLVLFVDHGKCEWINNCDLMQYTRSTMEEIQIPYLAIECRLSEIRPANGYYWHHAAKLEFQNILSKHKIHTIKIHSVVQSVIACDIYSTGISIRRELLDKGLGMECDELGPSQKNHQIRMDVKTLKVTDKTVIDKYSNDQFDHQTASTLARPTLNPNETLRSATPYTPLDISDKFVGLCPTTKTCVTIDSNSSNCVSVRGSTVTEPLMVAGEVRIIENSNIIVNKVTLIQSIPNFLPIICSIFAPHFYSVGSDGCESTIVCGPCDKPGIVEDYLGHQFEVHGLNEADIVSIQEIRKLMSAVMGKTLKKKQTHLQHMILKLLGFEGVVDTAFEVLEEDIISSDEERRGMLDEFYKCKSVLEVVLNDSHIQDKRIFNISKTIIENPTSCHLVSSIQRFMDKILDFIRGMPPGYTEIDIPLRYPSSSLSCNIGKPLRRVAVVSLQKPPCSEFDNQEDDIDYESEESEQPNQRLKCSCCGKYFSRLSNLKRHQKQFPNGRRKKNRTCPKCKRVFDNTRLLKKHISCRSGCKTMEMLNNPFKCVCGKAYASAAGRTRHAEVKKCDVSNIPKRISLVDVEEINAGSSLLESNEIVGGQEIGNDCLSHLTDAVEAWDTFFANHPLKDAGKCRIRKVLNQKETQNLGPYLQRHKIPQHATGLHFVPPKSLSSHEKEVIGKELLKNASMFIVAKNATRRSTGDNIAHTFTNDAEQKTIHAHLGQVGSEKEREGLNKDLQTICFPKELYAWTLCYICRISKPESQCFFGRSAWQSHRKRHTADGS